MILETATKEDAKECAEWVAAKEADGYVIDYDALKGGTMLKVAGCFYICACHISFDGRHAIRLGQLIPKPGISGKRLVIALFRMIKDIREEFPGDIVYPNYSENGVDQAARRIGGFEEIPGDPKIMILRGESHVLRA